MNEQQTPLEITIEDTVSINDLVALQNQGYSVMRSAHVGNLSPYNLAIAEAGIPILSVDHTITGVDRNYFPENRQTRNEQEVIAPLGQLVCRTRVLSGDEFLDDVQLASVRSALPAAKLMTNTEYLQANESVVGEIVSLAQAEFPHYFERLALPDGTTMKDRRAASLIDVYGVMQLNDEPRAEREAVIMPNILDIMANFVIEALRSERAVQYHLSGPDMVKYIGALLPDLQQLYARLRDSASYGNRLPAELEVRLVPTAAAKFATTKQRAQRVDALLEMVEVADEVTAAIRQDRKTFFSGPQAKDQQARQSLLSGIRENEQEIERLLGMRIVMLPELFCEPRQSGFVTQYDVLAEDGLYVSEANKSRSMRELASLVKRLDAINKRLSDL